MKKFARLSVGILLLACGACSASRQPGIEVRTVPVPTPVACVDAAQVPAEPASVGEDLTGQAQADLAIVAASALELRRWGRELVALIVPGCTAVSPGPGD